MTKKELMRVIENVLDQIYKDWCRDDVSQIKNEIRTILVYFLDALKEDG